MQSAFEDANCLNSIQHPVSPSFGAASSGPQFVHLRSNTPLAKRMKTSSPKPVGYCPGCRTTTAQLRSVEKRLRAIELALVGMSMEQWERNRKTEKPIASVADKGTCGAFSRMGNDFKHRDRNAVSWDKSEIEKQSASWCCNVARDQEYDVIARKTVLPSFVEVEPLVHDAMPLTGRHKITPVTSPPYNVSMQRSGIQGCSPSLHQQWRSPVDRRSMTSSPASMESSPNHELTSIATHCITTPRERCDWSNTEREALQWRPSAVHFVGNTWHYSDDQGQVPADLSSGTSVEGINDGADQCDDCHTSCFPPCCPFESVKVLTDVNSPSSCFHNATSSPVHRWPQFQHSATSPCQNRGCDCLLLKRLLDRNSSVGGLLQCREIGAGSIAFQRYMLSTSAVIKPRRGVTDEQTGNADIPRLSSSRDQRKCFVCNPDVKTRTASCWNDGISQNKASLWPANPSTVSSDVRHHVVESNPSPAPGSPQQSQIAKTVNTVADAVDQRPADGCVKGLTSDPLAATGPDVPDRFPREVIEAFLSTMYQIPSTSIRALIEQGSKINQNGALTNTLPIIQQLPSTIPPKQTANNIFSGLDLKSSADRVPATTNQTSTATMVSAWTSFGKPSPSVPLECTGEVKQPSAPLKKETKEPLSTPSTSKDPNSVKTRSTLIPASDNDIKTMQVYLERIENRIDSMSASLNLHEPTAMTSPGNIKQIRSVISTGSSTIPTTSRHRLIQELAPVVVSSMATPSASDVILSMASRNHSAGNKTTANNSYITSTSARRPTYQLFASVARDNNVTVSTTIGSATWPQVRRIPLTSVAVRRSDQTNSAPSESLRVCDVSDSDSVVEIHSAGQVDLTKGSTSTAPPSWAAGLPSVRPLPQPTLSPFVSSVPRESTSDAREIIQFLRTNLLPDNPSDVITRHQQSSVACSDTRVTSSDYAEDSAQRRPSTRSGSVVQAVAAVDLQDNWVTKTIGSDKATLPEASPPKVEKTTRKRNRQ